MFGCRCRDSENIVVPTCDVSEPAAGESELGQNRPSNDAEVCFGH
jgi:hypothetical protein